jgi:hypothetical protein
MKELWNRYPLFEVSNLNLVVISFGTLTGRFTQSLSSSNVARVPYVCYCSELYNVSRRIKFYLYMCDIALNNDSTADAYSHAQHSPRHDMHLHAQA